VFSDSIRASSLALASRRSASFQITFERSAGVLRDQRPSSKAALAARTARSTSALPALDTSASFSPVEGFSTAALPPSAGVTQAPLIHSLSFMPLSYLSIMP